MFQHAKTNKKHRNKTVLGNTKQNASGAPWKAFGKHQENLWKAIHQLKGDVICYVDADISNIHPRFVYALIAPLIHQSSIHYVKSFYERPIVQSGGDIRSTGGGRVTEILVRPLFSLFYPELTPLFQPLSGEYAVRREVLEQIPFPVGYGVETSHLLDVYDNWGMEAFAQVDLDKRIHRNQSTAALGRMSFGILQAFISRLRTQGKITTSGELFNTYRGLEITGPHYQEVTAEIGSVVKSKSMSKAQARALRGRLLYCYALAFGRRRGVPLAILRNFCEGRSGPNVVPKASFGAKP